MKEHTVRCRAPLRISFAGGGTEISPYVDEYGGLVLNATIGMHALATLGQSADGRVHMRALDGGYSASFDATSTLPPHAELRIPCAVYNYVVANYCDGRPLPVTLVTHCDAPPGSGLGSSSTLTVAILGAFDRYLRLGIEKYELAATAFHIERRILGLQGGHQDQYAAAFGGFNLMEFRQDKSVLINSLRIAPDIVRELECSLILFFTGRSRSSGDIIAAQSAKLRAQDSETIENLHRIKELVNEMRHALVAGDIPRLGRLLHDSWTMKKRTADPVSNSQIDQVYADALGAGAIGGKITGAGGGGFMMLVAEPDKKPAVIKQLMQASGGFILPTIFGDEGATGWRVQGADDVEIRRRIRVL